MITQRRAMIGMILIYALASAACLLSMLLTGRML